MKNAFVKLALGALLGASSVVHAAPVTFEFNIPNWDDQYHCLALP